MTDRRTLQSVHELFINIHVNDPAACGKPFAGIPFVFGGDFRQTLPVVLGVKGAEVLNYSLLRSDLWKKLTVCTLFNHVKKVTLGLSS